MNSQIILKHETCLVLVDLMFSKTAPSQKHAQTFSTGTSSLCVQVKRELVDEFWKDIQSGQVVFTNSQVQKKILSPRHLGTYPHHLTYVY